MNVKGWRVWYGDGSVYDSKQATWEALPNDGIVYIVLYFKELIKHSQLPYRRELSGYDYYFKSDGKEYFIYAGTNDLPKSINKRYKNPVIKRGKWVDDISIYSIEDKVKLSKTL